VDDDAVIFPHSYIAGPCYIGRGSWIVGGRISSSSIGPMCRGGGEVEELAVASLDMGKGFCPKCHKKTPSWARFCSHCGHELVEVKA